MSYDVLYLCDQKKVCSISDACGKRDGCIYTIDPKHTKNGPVTDQKDLNDRFEHIKMGGIEFWREKTSKKNTLKGVMPK